MHASDTHTHTHEGSHSTATETDAMYGCCCCISSSARVLVRVRRASERERQCVQSFARACDGERASGSVRRKSLRPHNLSLCLLVCVCVCDATTCRQQQEKKDDSFRDAPFILSLVPHTHTMCVRAKLQPLLFQCSSLCLCVCEREQRTDHEF